jgi:hypothetical protein
MSPLVASPGTDLVSTTAQQDGLSCKDLEAIGVTHLRKSVEAWLQIADILRAGCLRVEGRPGDVTRYKTETAAAWCITVDRLNQYLAPHKLTDEERASLPPTIESHRSLCQLTRELHPGSAKKEKKTPPAASPAPSTPPTPAVTDEDVPRALAAPAHAAVTPDAVTPAVETPVSVPDATRLLTYLRAKSVEDALEIMQAGDRRRSELQGQLVHVGEAVARNDGLQRENALLRIQRDEFDREVWALKYPKGATSVLETNENERLKARVAELLEKPPAPWTSKLDHPCSVPEDGDHAKDRLEELYAALGVAGQGDALKAIRGRDDNGMAAHDYDEELGVALDDVERLGESVATGQIEIERLKAVATMFEARVTELEAERNEIRTVLLDGCDDDGLPSSKLATHWVNRAEGLLKTVEDTWDSPVLQDTLVECVEHLVGELPPLTKTRKLPARYSPDYLRRRLERIRTLLGYLGLDARSMYRNGETKTASECATLAERFELDGPATDEDRTLEETLVMYERAAESAAPAEKAAE